MRSSSEDDLPPTPDDTSRLQLAVDAVSKDNHDPAMHQIHNAAAAETQVPVEQSRVNGVLGVGRQQPPADNSAGGTTVLCGPLLNYRRMSRADTEEPIWHGSVLLVTVPGHSPPDLSVRPTNESVGDSTATIRGDKLYEDPRGTFFAYTLELPFRAAELQWEYSFRDLTGKTNNEQDPNAPRRFWIPAKTESMRMMFHSCNGFSAGTDEDAWSGCALWNDVVRHHEQQPIHVMIGGGDQIYNDGVRVTGPLKPWTDIASPHKRRDFPFNEGLRAECDKYYFDNYVKWFGTEPFASANCQIPQLNIWDDHDIIDGFGSYAHFFQESSVFRGIGGIAYKYYLLFQHHLAPPKSTFTTDAPATVEVGDGLTAGTDAIQLKDSWVKIAEAEDASYIMGQKAGPYVEEVSRSLYCQLGARVALVGIDARTERTRHQINYPQTYDLIFDRVSKELAAAEGKLKHLILLLGIPIAYPRLQWLENILKSPIIGPIRFLNKRLGIGGALFNHFDGAVDIMDDLDDHYTAKQHKKERKALILRLQKLAKQYSIRVTILGGDVHLAAHGRFYSNPRLNIPAEEDWRFMPNIVSSAITNKPPPQAVANLLSRRNKIHHLDQDTDETLLNLFNVDPADGKAGIKAKAADSNHCTMPSRNFALITEAAAPPSVTTANSNGTGASNGYDVTKTNGRTRFPQPENPRHALHLGEVNCGSIHPAATYPTNSNTAQHTTLDRALDVCYRVEIDQHDRQGHTVGYGLSIPALRAGA